VVNEEAKNSLVKPVGFGKREGFANETRQALAQGIEPAFDMIGLAAFLAYRLMAITGENQGVSAPEVAERIAAFPGAWDALPQAQATGLAAVTDEPGDNNAGVDLWGSFSSSAPNPPLKQEQVFIMTLPRG